MAWVRHHMERQMLEHIVLDYSTVHRRDGWTNNRQAEGGGEGGRRRKGVGGGGGGLLTEGR